ncbi:hypothetical protein SAMN04488514_105124 [Kriegella aquimaris]|uniref:Uncharacterized protein n=1 Tax=Kriegella aquimaris TaxID=192904 RepID=A0A1G9QNF9_9FLAO|nr:hypothetical protein SAMN04488514_105124 [Kriegella aquimaris]
MPNLEQKISKNTMLFTIYTLLYKNHTILEPKNTSNKKLQGSI